MTGIEVLYARLLHFGLMQVRDAFRTGNHEWLQEELEMLHNIPSLLGEANVHRHYYYWFSERVRYIEWASGPGREDVKSRMVMFYEPIWQEMEPLLAKLFVTIDGPSEEET